MGNSYKYRIICTLMALCLCVAALGITSYAEEDGESTSRVPVYTTAQSYSEYLESYDSAVSGSDTVVLAGADYASTDGMDVTVDDDVVLTDTSGSITWEVEVGSAGFYQIDIEYAVVPDGGNEIQLNLLLNGEVPFAQVTPLVFYRMYTDESDDYKEMEGNQSFPSQIEYSDWQTVSLTDSEGYYGESNGLWFYLEEGVNELTFEAVKDRMMIRTITVRPAENLPDYDTYLAACLEDGAEYMESAEVRFQGEDASLKSDPSFYPQNNRTSALTEPYDPTYIVLNTIGGSAWSTAGSWIEWEVEVPESGLYKIAVRYKQKETAGFEAYRSVSINGTVPYAEAEAVAFSYSTSFQTEYLHTSDGEELWFYLEEGTNTIRLTCSLGGYADVAVELQDCIDYISEIYYSITAITSTSPTAYQDYQLTTRLPNLTTELQEAGEQLAALQVKVEEICGGTTDVSASMSRTAQMLLEIAAKPSQITNKVTSIGDSITSLGSAVLTLSQQSLTLDWLELQGEDDTLPRAEGTFLQGLKHEVLSFIGSFTNDYNVAVETDTDAEQTVTVWISTGRDQMDVLRRLVNESFTSETGIAVDIKLVDSSIIMTAVAGGTGPDVAIGVSSTLPMELGYREAAYDLSQFEDFEDVTAMLSEAAVDCYEFEGAYYGLPDQMSFPVLFYRKDILAKYNIEVPETWEDLISIIPTLATYNMQVYLDRESLLTLGTSGGVGTSKAINTVFLSMLYQTGGELYNEAGTMTLLTESVSLDAFKTWTNFYTKYGFSASMSFVTRFRLGSVPIAIMDISYYNTLTVSAPEIDGKWGIALIPGTEQEDGTIDHSVPVTTSAVMMIKSSVEKNDSADASWEFIKWWLSSDVQTSYSREMEAVLGSSGRYMVSNLTSFSQISWSADVAAVLEESLEWIREVRQIPGSYLTGRNLENAFYAVINDTSLDSTDTLSEYVESIDREITKKREEYGLETE
ncbi:MAG: extracellular solute-binding protein [Lachnospiraceae bacterium]|nr:extracellular solute-binding protein [Lachnospiraceae bacterium]